MLLFVAKAWAIEDSRSNMAMAAGQHAKYSAVLSFLRRTGRWLCFDLDSSIVLDGVSDWGFGDE